MTTCDLKNEMRCVVCFCYRLGKFAPETIDMMKEAYKEDCISRRYFGHIKRFYKVVSQQSSFLLLIAQFPLQMKSMGI